MSRKLVFLMALLVLTGIFSVVIKPTRVKASGIIYIRANGSIDPPTANITTTDKITYTFTGNIYDEIVVERDNIILDGRGYTLRGINMTGKGITMIGRSNVTINNMEIKAFYHGIYLNSSSISTIIGNNITDNTRGIYFYSSSNNTVSGNIITNTTLFAVSLFTSSCNIVSGNNITNNLIGVDLLSSSNNTLVGNSIAYNKYNFAVWGEDLPDYINDIDTSNTVDGKPIYYWINKQDMVVPSDAGYVALINCTRTTVTNLSLTNNRLSLLLAYTTNSTITKNNVRNNEWGISFHSSSCNIVSGNTITNNYQGISFALSSCNTVSGNSISNNEVGAILLWDSSNNNTISDNNIIQNNQHGIGIFIPSSNNAIIGNNITDNNRGIHFYASSNNTISGNIITNNSVGVALMDVLSNATEEDLFFCSNNKFFHNSFINNHYGQVAGYNSPNVWDDGYPSGGNYWSDYAGVDLDHDGIGDTAHEIDADNIDHNPLMGMFHSFNTSLGKHVNVISNSTIENFEYIQSDKTIRMHLSNMTGNQTFGFCRICIPKALINETYRVFVNGTEILPAPLPLPCSNSTHNYLYFNYTHSLQEVVIVPEFPSFLILPLFMTVTLLAVIVYRKKLSMT